MESVLKCKSRAVTARAYLVTRSLVLVRIELFRSDQGELLPLQLVIATLANRTLANACRAISNVNSIYICLSTYFLTL